MTKYKIVPVEPTREMILELMSVGLRHAEYVDERGPSVAEMAQGYHFMLAAAPSPWISVEERLPEDKEPILMVSVSAGPRRDYTTDQYAGWRIGDNWARWPHDDQPTHWMPLPEAPEKSE